MHRSIRSLLAEVETLPEGWALVQLDRALASGWCTSVELIRHARHCSERVQWLVAIADARGASTPHSLLRRAWYAANLPTPIVGRRLLTPWGAVATSCATDYHRFAVATSADPEPCAWLARLGWRVLVVDEQKVLAASTATLSGHLRAEHLRHLASASG
ncbi:MAG: hypothetical protein ACTHOG_06455 [Marmoricola sp.]